MSRDDYWDKVDDDQRYADYKYDQTLFERDLSTRTTDVYDALGKGDHDAAAWALRIPGSPGQQTSGNYENTQPQRQTVSSELPLLISEISRSDYIDDYLKTHWIKGLQPITRLNRPAAHRRILDFKAAFAHWKVNNRPQENIWDISNNQRWLFDTEMLLIECKIDRIAWLLSRPVDPD